MREGGCLMVGDIVYYCRWIIVVIEVWVIFVER